MAVTPCWMLVLGDASWQVARVQGEAVHTSEPRPFDRQQLGDVVGPIHEELVEQGYAGEPILLALGSLWCVSLALNVPSQRHARNRDAMKYLAEPFLPWAAEEIVVDHEVDGSRAFLVAAALDPLAELVEGLEGLEARIQFVTPLARLAVDDYLSKSPNQPKRYGLYWGNDEGVERWLIDEGKPVAWERLSHDAPTIARSIKDQSLSENAPVSVVHLNLRPDVHDELSAMADVEWPDAPDGESVDLVTAGLREAAAVLSGRRTASIDLRRDALGIEDRFRSIRRHLAVLQFAVLLLLTTMGIALFLQAQRYDALRLSLGDQQVDVFREVFPQQKVPVGVRARLEGELARLQGMRGGDVALPLSAESMDLLQRLMRALPSDFRFRLLEIRIEDGRLYLVGQVREHSDADRIAEALREVGFDVASPSTHRLQVQGVEFRVSARLSVSSEEGGNTI